MRALWFGIGLGMTALCLGGGLIARQVQAQNAIRKPQPRSGHALVYDSRRQQVLLVNGDHDAQARKGEVWAWNGKRWNLIDTGGPPPRTLSGVAYDTRRGVLVVQGGIGPGDKLNADTQEWDGKKW